jgi:hypothetical protein
MRVGFRGVKRAWRRHVLKSPNDPGRIKTHTWEKCTKYNSPTPDRTAGSQHVFTLRCGDMRTVFERVRSFHTAKTHRRYWRRIIAFKGRSLHLRPPAKAREPASRAFALALARATCATIQKRWRPKHEAPRQAAIELLPTQLSHRQRKGEALLEPSHSSCMPGRLRAFINSFT